MSEGHTERLEVALDGKYRIERKLGEGGMASVYLAEDIKHERQVALKILRPELAAVLGAERFLSEIKTTANLQHPHILALFDSGEADGYLYYVMPYIDGETLREKLDREKQLGVEEAVRIARDVADALDYAHRAGVIHRDIKPGNILLHDGRPVVADFGIALAVGGAGGSRLTETGLSVGTPQYMSPEQATGDHAVGPTSDVYALGCVLYEMLVGEAPFTGSTPQAILGKIIAGKPASVSGQRPSVPANVDAAIHQALENVAADRFASCARFVEALSDHRFRGRQGARGGSARRSRSRFLWPGAAVVASVLAAWGWLRSGALDPAVWSQVVLPEGQLISTISSGSHPLAITRDGGRIAYVATSPGASGLHTRDLANRLPTLLEGTNGAHQPFFSPDGAWVGYFEGDQMLRASVVGGAPITITTLPAQPTHGASWGADGTIVFSSGENLYRVASAGGEPESVELVLDGQGSRGADSTANAGGVRWPAHLPGDDHILVSVPQGTAVVEHGAGNGRVLFDGVQARYLPPGYLVFNAGEERLRAVRFDLDRLEVVGAEVPALEGVFRGQSGGAAAFAVSETGTLVYLAGGFDRSLWRVDRNGGEERIPVEARGYRWPRVSPDGTRIAVTVDPRPSDLWVLDWEGTAAERLTTEGHHVNPAWSPDSERLVFSLRDDLHEMPARSDGAPRRISDRALAQYMPSWSLNDVIMVNEPNSESWDLVAIEVGDGSATDFVATRANELTPTFSPDGRWVAYVSDTSGRSEVYVRAFPGQGSSHQVSFGSGFEPKWSADGTEIVFRNLSGLWAVDVSTSPRFVAGSPSALFDAAAFDFSQSNNWDMGPDGSFVMVKSDPSMRTQLEVLQNFSAILDERAAGR